MRTSFTKRQRRTGYLFVSPWLFGAIFLLVYPFVFSLMLSFSDIKNNDFTTMYFVGLQNYKEAFVEDISFLPMFYEIIVDTVVNTPMIVIFALLVAIAVNKDIRGKGFFRAVFFLPVLLGTGFVMKQLLGQNVQEETMAMARGILMPEMITAYIGPDLSTYIAEFFGRITMVMWSSGVQIIIILAGLQGISPSLYEVAQVDGASGWEMFWKITLPMSAPILLLAIVYTIVASFTKSSSMMDYIIAQAFGSVTPKFAYSAALGWIYFLLVLVVILLVFAIMRPAVRRVSER